MAFFLYGNFCGKIAIPHQTVDMNDCFPTSGETQTLVDMDIKITSIAHKSERKLRLILILLERYICWQFSVAHYLFQNADLLPKCNGASVGSFSQEREILFWKGLNVITASMNPVQQALCWGTWRHTQDKSPTNVIITIIITLLWKATVDLKWFKRAGRDSGADSSEAKLDFAKT